MKRVATMYDSYHSISLEKQNKEFERAIKSNPEWSLAKEYVGFDRELFAKSVAEGIEGRVFDILLVHEFGAFANKNNFISNIVKDYGIEIWSVTEGKLDTSKHTLKELIWEE